MKIQYKQIILRDVVESDIEDQIRWCNEETAWSDWDAPDEPIEPVDPESYRAEALRKMKESLPKVRNAFALAAADGRHIGSVTSYLIGEDCQWISHAEAQEKGVYRWTIGVDICESSYWGKGLGTMAIAAFCKYFLDSGRTDLYTQTWSGNERMLRCAQRIGFAECHRIVGDRNIRGGTYDTMTLKLDLDSFHNYLKENP